MSTITITLFTTAHAARSTLRYTRSGPDVPAWQRAVEGRVGFVKWSQQSRC